MRLLEFEPGSELSIALSRNLFSILCQDGGQFSGLDRPESMSPSGGVAAYDEQRMRNYSEGWSESRVVE